MTSSRTIGVRGGIAVAVAALGGALLAPVAAAGPQVVYDDGGSHVAPAAPTYRITTTLSADASRAVGWRAVAVSPAAARVEDVRGGRVLSRVVTATGATNSFTIARGARTVVVPNRYRREAYAPRLQPGANAVLYLRFPSDTSISLTRSDAAASRSVLTQSWSTSETRAYSPPAVSSDGTTVYWLRATCIEAGACSHAVTLYRISLLSGAIAAFPVTGVPRYVQFDDLRLSPDGTRLLVVGSPEYTDGDTVPARPYVIRVTGGAARLVPLVVRDASWSGDGGWLVVVVPAANPSRAYTQRARTRLYRYSLSRNRLLPVSGSGTLRTWTFGLHLVP